MSSDNQLRSSLYQFICVLFNLFQLM